MKRQHGFTLIELLTVMVIVSILATIVLPQFKDFRKRAYDVKAQSDLRTLAIAEEAYFLDAEHYFACGNARCADLPGLSHFSSGVEASARLVESEFLAKAKHIKGTGKTFYWDSSYGGMTDEIPSEK